jgi:hypothetical protein
MVFLMPGVIGNEFTRARDFLQFKTQVDSRLSNKPCKRLKPVAIFPQTVEKGPSAEGLLEAVRKNKSRSTVRGVPRQLGPGTLARLASHQAVLRTLRTAPFFDRPEIRVFQHPVPKKTKKIRRRAES